jgi:hypothetical protein
MTPKEKAKELFDKIYKLDNRAWYDTAKQCALIAVDEILNAVRYLDDESEEYWQEVKQEIQAL